MVRGSTAGSQIFGVEESRERHQRHDRKERSKWLHGMNRGVVNGRVRKRAIEDYGPFDRNVFPHGNVQIDSTNTNVSDRGSVDDEDEVDIKEEDGTEVDYVSYDDDEYNSADADGHAVDEVLANSTSTHVITQSVDIFNSLDELARTTLHPPFQDEEDVVIITTSTVSTSTFAVSSPADDTGTLCGVHPVRKN